MMRHTAIAVVLLVGLTGCGEAWQRKFVRKKKEPVGRPQAIVQFTDYTRTITPLDRYRKHHSLFEYWNEQVLSELPSSSTMSNTNAKRLRKASSEALTELKLLQGLLMDEPARALGELVDDRERIDRQIQRGLAATEADIVRQRLDQQSRAMDRSFAVKDVADKLQQ